MFGLPLRSRRLKGTTKLALLAVSAALLSGAAWGWQQLRPYPAVTAGDAERGARAFTDSDLGTQIHGSLPRAVWEAIPVVFPEWLPEGWRGIGLITRPDDPRGPPVGLARTSLMGVEMYATNCSLCHAGSFQGKVVLGAPNTDLDIQYMVWVIGEALRSQSLTFAAVDKVAQANGRPLTGVERQGVRAWLALARQKSSARPSQPFSGTAGAGRSDNLNGFKRLFGLPESHTALVDQVSVFNRRLKTRNLVDGSITGDETARVMLSELQKGRPARDVLLHRAVFEDVVAYIEKDLAPPSYPFPVDAALAQKGHAVFSDSCSRCHGTYAPDAASFPNLQISLSKVGTDPERALAMSADLVAALQSNDFRQYLKIEATNTYVPPPLGGLWVTAPYLHNGSVPTLWHLLHPEQRPVSFYRRWNEYDPVRVGFVCRGSTECAPDATQSSHDPRTLSHFDSRAPGNDNGGHLYGDELPEEDKAALLEYLKTI